MIEGFDETRLLAYVEGEMTAEDEVALRRDLAPEPRVLAALDQLRADRALLRSMPAPEAPAELTATFEAAMARPMLMGGGNGDARAPGSYRRQFHARDRRRRLVVGMAAAASLLLAAGAGLVIVVGQLSGPGSGSTDVLASGDDQPAPPVTSSDPSMTPDGEADDTWPPAGSDLHHALPGHRPSSAVRLADRTPGDVIHGTGTGQPVPLPFTLVVSAEAIDDWERAAVSELESDRRVALVQNFSQAEAVAIETYLRGRRVPGLPPRPMMADAGHGPDRASVTRLRQWEKLVRDIVADLPAPERPTMSRQLTGRRDLAAPVARQLTFSDRGATHTVTVPLSELGRLLSRLDELTDGSATLRMLPEAEADAGSWLADRDAIRRAVARLRGEHPDAVVLLPLTVRETGSSAP